MMIDYKKKIVKIWKNQKVFLAYWESMRDVWEISLLLIKDNSYLYLSIINKLKAYFKIDIYNNNKRN